MNKIYKPRSIFGMKYIWKLLLCFTIFVMTQEAKAQIVPLANGLSDTVVLACTNGKDLYVLTRKSNATTDSLKTYHWDGKSWKKLFSFFFYNHWGANGQISAMHYYNNELYLGGRFDSVSSVPGYNNLMRWDGNNLLPLDSTIISGEQSVTAMQVYTNELIIAGLDHDGNNPFFYSWNGARVVDMDSVQTGYEMFWFGHHLHVTGDQLYANLKLKEAGKNRLSNLALWNGNFWEPISFSPDSMGAAHYMNTDDILSLTLRGVERWQSGSWNLVAPDQDKILNATNVLQMISFDNTIWVLVQNKISGLDPRIVTLYKWDGENWGKVLKDTSDYTQYNFIRSEEAVYLYGDFKDFGGLSLNYAGKISELAKFSGNIFYDVNNNCIKDLGEFSDNRSFISISSGALSTINTDAKGNYVFYADSGTYTIKAIPAKYWKQICPAVTVNAEIDSTYVNNFALTPKYLAQDIRLTLTGATGWRARQGFTESYTLCYENIGTTIAAGTINLTLDSNFTNFTSVPPAEIYHYPFAQWNFDSLEIGEKRCITFLARLDSAATDDSVQFTTFFDGGDGWLDSSIIDNFDTLKQQIVGALDPNDKTSFPAGDITADTKELRYQIRFQNVGTDTAYRIVVIDTIDTNLPLTKVMMNSSSHKYKLNIKNNVFKWTFDEIMLPDNKTNEPKSHGFINYSAQIKPGVAIGTEIKNTAYIYFDYQKPVITNTVRSKMVEEPVGIREEKGQSISATLHIYPNPASDYVNIKNDGLEEKQIQLVNVLGQIIETTRIQPFEIRKINTENLKTGIYFIRAEGETVKIIIE